MFRIILYLRSDSNFLLKDTFHCQGLQQVDPEGTSCEVQSTAVPVVIIRSCVRPSTQFDTASNRYACPLLLWNPCTRQNTALSPKP